MLLPPSVGRAGGGSSLFSLPLQGGQGWVLSLLPPSVGRVGVGPLFSLPL